jgi:AdoMet-dependent heme synthase
MRKLAERVGEGANGLVRALRVYAANRSIRAWSVLARHLVRKALGLPSPTYLHVSLTERCQCRCVHCYARGREDEARRELDTAEVKDVIDQGRRLGAAYVVFSGGEPLLRKDIVELVAYAHRKGLITRINTNGLLFTPENTARLRKAGLTQAGVSIDDPDPETHDRLRALPGAYARTMDGIRNLKRNGILCQIQTYASRRLIPEGLKKVIAMGRELGVFYVYFFFPTASGAWACSFDEVLTPEEREEVRKLADIRFVHVELATASSKCRVFARSLVSVASNGDVTPCPFTPFVIGNVRDKPLGELWRPFSSRLKLKFRGDCIMNDNAARASMAKHVQDVAGERP